MALHNLEVFQNELAVSNVHTTIIRKDNSNLSMIDNGFRLHLYGTYPYETMFTQLKQYVKPNTILQIIDNFNFMYYMVFVPSHCLNEEDSPYFIIGPFLNLKLPAEDIHGILKENQVPEHLLTDITSLYDSLPIIHNIPMFVSFILHLAHEYLGEVYTVTDTSKYLSPLFQTIQPVIDIEENSEIALSSIEERYKVENQLIAAITSGDYKRALLLHQKFTTFYIKPRTDNVVKNTQNSLIILNTLCRKAVEFADVHPLYIDELSRKIAISINHMNTMRELKNIETDILHKYCLLVVNHSMKGYSLVTKDIISYIDFHYMEELSLNFFADMFNLSKTYLSNLFKKETGSTLTDFIHHVRMRKAITLLNSSDLTITSIATACGYNDISYFIRIFRRTYGMSTKQYQKSVLRLPY